jgi:hypothetical protein
MKKNGNLKEGGHHEIENINPCHCLDIRIYRLREKNLREI